MVSVRSSVRDTQGRSRVPELGPLGSMRGASSNGRPYRERRFSLGRPSSPPCRLSSLESLFLRAVA